MKRYIVTVEFDVKTNDPRGVGEQIFAHVFETFNDDNSIRKSGFVLFKEVKPS